MTLRLSLSLPDADALFAALAVVRPALRPLGPTALAEIDGPRVTIQADLPMLAEGSEPELEPVEELVRRVVGKAEPFLVGEGAPEITDTLGLDMLAGILVGKALLDEGGAPPAPSNDDQEINPLSEHDVLAAEAGAEDQDEERSCPDEQAARAEAIAGTASLAGAGVGAQDQAPALPEGHVPVMPSPRLPGPGLEGAAAPASAAASSCSTAAAGVPGSEAQPSCTLTALGAVWTKDDERTLLALQDKGLTSKQIGERMGRTTKAVDSRLMRLRKAGVAKHRTKGHGVKVPAERDAEMARLHAAGMTPGEIAARFGLTRQAVRLRLAKLAERVEAQEPAEPVQELHKLPSEPTEVDVSPDPLDVSAAPVDGTHSISELVASAPQPEPEPRAPVTGPWSPDEDLILVEGLAEGRLLAPVMERLGRGQADCLERFDELVGPDQTGRSLRDAVERVRQRAALQIEAAE